MSNEAIQVQQAEIVQAMDTAAIDVQISTAKSYPRHLPTVLTQIQTYATMDEETAEDCFYALRRAGQGGQQLIEGLSVRMAEIIAGAWGNMRVQTSIIANDGKTIEVTDDIMADINELKIIKPQLDELTKTKKEIEDRIKFAMADAETLCLPGTLESNPKAVATYKSAKDSTKFDQDAFKADHPDLYDQYCKTVPGTRRFLVK